MTGPARPTVDGPHERPPGDGLHQTPQGFVRGLEDRCLHHVEKSTAAVEGADTHLVGTPLHEDGLRVAEIHASLAETLARVIHARTKRWRDQRG